MSILDVSEQNRSLDNDYGATHGPNAPAEHELILYTGDPRSGGVELNTTDCPGYAPTPVPNDAGWPAAEEGEKARLITLPTPAGAWSQVGLYWGLRNTTTGGVADVDRLDKPISPSVAGGTLKITATVRYGSLIDND